MNPHLTDPALRDSIAVEVAVEVAVRGPPRSSRVVDDAIAQSILALAVRIKRMLRALPR